MYIASVHQRQVIGAQHARQLQFHNKGICRHRGALRAEHCKHWTLCGRSVQVRDPREGDSIVDRVAWRVRSIREAAEPQPVIDSELEEVVQLPDAAQVAGAQPPAAAPAGVAVAFSRGQQPQASQSAGAPTRPSQLSSAAPAQSQRRRQIQLTQRTISCPADLAERAGQLGNATCIEIPLSLLARYTLAWTECLEGIVAGSETWCMVGRYRARLLQTLYAGQESKAKELSQRLYFWKIG